MLKQSSVFALALVSSSAIAGPLANAVNGLLGVSGPTAAPLTAPLGTALAGPLSSLDNTAQPVTSAEPLAGLTTQKSTADLLAVGVLDGNNTGNGGSISAAVLSGENSGESGDPNGMTLSVGVLNQGDPLHIYGMGMGIGDEPGLDPNPLPSALTNPLLGLSNVLYDGLRDLTLETLNLDSVLAPVGGLADTVTGALGAVPLPVATGVRDGLDLFGGSANNSGTAEQNNTLNAGALNGDNSGSGGLIGVAVLSTSANNNPDSSARSSTVGVGVLNGNGPPPNNNVVVVDPGSNPDGNKESEQGDLDSELCAILAKDNRGQVKGKLREKAQCAKKVAPKA